MTVSQLNFPAAHEIPNGARFYKCALQVNPLGWVERHGHASDTEDEESYNDTLVAALLREGIEAIAVTDHYRIKTGRLLIDAARKAGIFVFPGFEAKTKDGVHFLCIFDPNEEDNLERYIGFCGIIDDDAESPLGKLDAKELLEETHRWGAACIAAHATNKGGILKTLSGLPRANVWKSPYLLAVALPGSVSEAPTELQPILTNRDAAHKRGRLPAFLNTRDIGKPEDIALEGASCFIKMSDISVEGLRQAFLDPHSRIRLSSEPKPEPHAEFLLMDWQGGFLDGTRIRFNENLNVLIGGRGAGKSTVIESVRYVLGLDPIGPDAQKSHQGVVRQVLMPGTKVTLKVRSHKPAERVYIVERTVPNPPVVKDDTGLILDLSPSDVVPNVDIFGQHEISELTKSPEKLTLLLERFAKRDRNGRERKREVLQSLQRSRARIFEISKELERVTERLAALPSLEETQKRFKDAGLEKRLKEKSALVKEQRLVETARERTSAISDPAMNLREAVNFDLAFLSDKAIADLPNRGFFVDLRERLSNLSSVLTDALAPFDKSLDGGKKELDASIREVWEKLKGEADERYQALLRELQKTNVDGEEFIRNREQIETLRPLKEGIVSLRRELAANESERKAFLDEWENTKSSEYRETVSAAKQVGRLLKNHVRVSVKMSGDQSPLETVLRELGGNLSSAVERLREREVLSLPAFVQACRDGKQALRTQYGFSPRVSEKIGDADPDLLMRIEELNLPATTTIELNAGTQDAPSWKSLEALSAGQKATAVLLILLLGSEAPLVVDQPEDDLDNRFIADVVVPTMREQKRRRQFLFSSHNANIPVLGDAELILVLSAEGEAGEGHGLISMEHRGSIDAMPVQELVEEILEGGKEAFEMRRSKYGLAL